MSRKTPNTHIACTVDSCAHHCEDCDHCSLNDIVVHACDGKSSGLPAEESMCASYTAR